MKISNGKIIIHEFKVLDMRSYTTSLIGRDYMQLFDTVKFDFKQNIVHLGNTCVKCITLRNKGTVRINECTTVKTRSEQVINV